MLQLHRVDGFQLFAGLLAVVAGPIILATGTLAPGWGVVITLAGAIVLWSQWKEGRRDRHGDGATPPRTRARDHAPTVRAREDAVGASRLTRTAA